MNKQQIKALKNFYEGQDIEKIEKPKKINGAIIFNIIEIIAMLIITITLLSYMYAYYELRDDYNWAKENPIEFINSL